MKSLILFLFLFFVVNVAISQQRYKSLDIEKLLITQEYSVESTTKASLPCPKMTEAQRDAISPIVSGRCVYNTDTNLLNIYSGIEWVNVGEGAGASITEWMALTDYEAGDLVIYDDFLYQANSDFTSGAMFTPANWDAISKDTPIDLADNTNDVTGVLALSNGGTEKSITASAGSVVYSDADSFELTAVGTSGQYLKSNGTSAPSWDDIIIPDQFNGYNFLSNPSFENDTLGVIDNWTFSGGTFAKFTYTYFNQADLYAGLFTASALNDYIESDLYYIPDYSYGGCEAGFDYAASVDGFVYEVYDQSANILASGTLVASAVFTNAPKIRFTCPVAGASNQVKLRITAPSAGSLFIDHAYLGNNTGVVIADIRDTYTARISDAGVVSFENQDWINGNCSLNVDDTFLCTLSLSLDNPLNCNITRDGDNNSDRTFTKVRSDLNSNTVFAFAHNADGATVQIAADSYVTCSKTGSDAGKSQPAISPEQSDWYIDVNIGGANPSLGTANVATYTEITDAGLDMVINSGSKTAQIPCSTTNPSTGLTCAVGNESIGVVFTPPFAGIFEVCSTVTHNINQTSGTVNATFQLVETPNNAQTILQESNNRQGSFLNGTNVATYKPVRNCGLFTFNDVSKKTIRLMYEQATSPTIAANTIVADRGATTGQRDMHITVRPWLRGTNTPVLLGNQVTAPRNGDLSKETKICLSAFGGAGSIASPTACTTGTCIEYEDTCNALTITHSGTAGYYDVVVASGTFAPNSLIHINSRNGNAGHICSFPAPFVTNGSGGYSGQSRCAIFIGGSDGNNTNTFATLELIGVRP